MNFPTFTPLRLAAALSVAFSTQAFSTISIDWITVGNAGNDSDLSTGFGGVAYEYQIAKNETTIGQYAAFLNAAAKTDTYGLYDSSMANDANIAGIQRTGSAGTYAYSVVGSGNRPITYVSWFDAARFANWLHHGQPTGALSAGLVEDGAYTLLGATSGIISKNVGAKSWIPSEDEWYKAAYYDPTKFNPSNGTGGGYWRHANQSENLSSNIIGVPGAANFCDAWPLGAEITGSGFATTPGNDIYSSSQNYLTEVGAYGEDSDSYYGVNDQAGNVWEWNDGVSGQWNDGVFVSTSRGWRGGSWGTPGFDMGMGIASIMSSLHSYYDDPTRQDSSIGFRIASAVPEPTSLVLTLLTSGVLLIRRKR
jgi:sulfatase modifying factor 1